MPAGKPGELSETINSNPPASQAVAVFRISRDLCNPRVCLLITQALRSRVSFTSQGDEIMAYLARPAADGLALRGEIDRQQ